MKNIKFLLGLFAVVIIMASCVTTQSAMYDDMDDPRTQQIGNRIYMQDPFYGTVVLERDPYTGRYYDVTFGQRFGTGYYGRPMAGFNRGGGVIQGGTNRSFGGSGNVVKPQAPSRETIRQDREATRNRILGN
jgi:hypothetical protein